MKSMLRVYQDSTNKYSSEPAVTVGVSTASVAGLLAILGYVFPNLIDERAYEITMVVSAFLLPIITALITRGKVWSPVSVGEVVRDAIKAGEEAAIGIKKPNTTSLPEE